MSDFGDALRTIRVMRGMTQEEFAELLGTSKQVISRYENGQRSPKISVAKEYAERLGITLSELNGDAPTVISYPGIEPITQTYRLPLLGPVAAGEPIQVDPEDAEYVNLPYHPGKADAALRVEGDSMQPKYMDGDVVFIRYQDDVEDGQIAAVCIDDKATLKRIYHIPNGVQLVSENAAYRPMTYTMEDANNIHLIGLAVGYMRWE